MIRSVLVVDDERDIVDVLGQVLENAGFRVSTAHDGRATLDHVLAKRPGLILLDVMLPELSGMEVLKTLRKREETRTIPVILLTAKKDEIDRVVGRDERRESLAHGRLCRFDEDLLSLGTDRPTATSYV